MKIIETGFRDLKVIKPVIYSDSRGYFFESYNQLVLSKEGITFNPVQDNESRSVKGVIRGLHYQLNPFAQTKLIRVIYGRILDVALDLRKGSDTFGKWFSAELDSENKEQLLIPGGFAHGFSVLSDTAVIQYKCDNVYSPQNERGISVNDPELGIDWKTGNSEKIISEKDLRHPLFRDAEYNFLF
jgi:dTDP-4-dehydrorhamnose 3,5-epimerase